MTRFTRFVLPLAAALTTALLVPTSTARAQASTLNEGLRLNSAITVTGDTITLGDIFDGYLSRPEKVVADAPRPGQRMILPAEWLADLARIQGLDWRPANAFDRAVVYQPGLTIAAEDIMRAVKDALIANGMPANFGISAAAPVAPVTVAATGPVSIEVREAIFAASTNTFSAVAQIPPGDPKAAFVQIRGYGFPTVTVPVLRADVNRDTVISGDMVTTVDLPEDQVTPAIITETRQLIGKTPKIALRAGLPVINTDVVQITLVDVPVLATDMDRNGHIAARNVKIAQVNAATLPADAVMDEDFLIGKSPRRTLTAGLPIRRADVRLVRQIEVPIAARDLSRGTILTESDFTWVVMNESEVAGEVVGAEEDIVGMITRHSVRAGQPMRKHSVAKPIAVERGQLVTVVWSAPGMNLTAQARVRENGGVGDVVRVINSKSNQVMLAEVIDARTVRVAGAAH